jgi:hypothetical protein
VGWTPKDVSWRRRSKKTQLAEVLAEYTARKSVDEQLRPEFHVNRPYRLLTDTEADQFRDRRFAGKPSTPLEPGLAEIFGAQRTTISCRTALLLLQRGSKAPAFARFSIR